MAYIFKGLTAVVQYRRKDDAHWATMAAFDYRSVAEKYALGCRDDSDDFPWEYRVIDAPPDGTDSA